MKEKMKTFSEQAIVFIHVLLVLLFIETIAVISRKGAADSGKILLGILAAAFALCIIYFSFNRLWLTPYRKYCSLFKKFIDGQTYNEIFDSEYEVFPGMKAALKRFEELLDKQNAIQLSTKQAEFLALQNQINPHFLYNTLEAIRGDALCAGLENIAEITEALSTFFRYTITETENLVTLENELENVENYFMIQQYRFGEKLKMEINLPDGEPDALQLQLPKLTLQPIIENAIFHGLEGKSDGGTITIEVEITQNRVLLSIRDNGMGIPEEKLESINNKLDHVFASYINVEKKKKGSIALNNVCRRIKLLFGEDYGIHIFSIVDVGTDVRISIPVIKSQKGVHS